MTKEETKENLAWRIRTDEMIAVELKENHRMKGVPYEIIAFGNIWSYKPVILWGNGVFSSLAYPGYDWMSMAVSELSAVGAPSRELAAQLNSLFGSCAVLSIMAVLVNGAMGRQRTRHLSQMDM